MHVYIGTRRTQQLARKIVLRATKSVEVVGNIHNPLAAPCVGSSNTIPHSRNHNYKVLCV
jgi:hypothetical protein